MLSNINSAQKIMEDLFPFSSRVVCVDNLVQPVDYLFPEEQKIAYSFSAGRLKEFSIGRYCARKALFEAGVSNFPVLKAHSGHPIWPENFVGSITHTPFIIAAVVASKSAAQSIGIDIEEISNFPTDMKDIILRDDENYTFQEYGEYSNDVKLALFFSIKESVYKAYNPIYKNFLDFKDVKLILNKSKRSFRAVIDSYSLGQNSEQELIEGFFSINSGRVYTSAWILK